MNKIFIEIIKLSIYSCIPIFIFICLSNSKISSYSSKFKYSLSIIIAIRMLFIFKFKIYLPNKFNINNSVNTKFLKLNTYSELNTNNFNIFSLLLYIWISIVIFISIYIIYKYIKFNVVLSRVKQNINDDLIIKTLLNQKKNLNINRSIEIYKLNGLYTPIIMGIFKPKIVLPNRKYTESELNFILKHELTHYKRKDNFFKYLMMIINIIYWFNPTIYILRNFFYEQCELSCDETVIKNCSLNEIKQYSLILLSTIKSKNKIEIPLYISQLKTKKSNKIKRRINDMFQLRKKKSGIILGIILCTTITATTFSLQSTKSENMVYAEGMEMDGYVKAQGTNGKVGYIKKDDLYNPQPLDTLEQVEAYVKEKEKNPFRMINLYDESGKNIIGEYRID